MEKEIEIGKIGKLDLVFSGGKATISANVAVPGGLTAAISVSDDAGALIDLLESIVAKAVPATAPFDPAIFAVIKSAVIAIQ